MDGILPTPQPPRHQSNMFLVGTSIAILLLLLILVLNYFNILSLSRLFPSQLWWLPHKAPMPSLQSTSTQNQSYTSNDFQYDTKKAKTILTEYIKNNIKPQFIPENLEIKQGLSIDNKLGENKYTFGSYFIHNQTTISVNFHYKENTNTPNDFFIFTQPTKVGKTTLTPDIANSSVASYFINASPITNCDKKETTSYCENFRTESDGKRGYGALIGQDQSRTPPATISIVFTCFIPKESRDYDTTQSCISL